MHCTRRKNVIRTYWGRGLNYFLCYNCVCDRFAIRPCSSHCVCTMLFKFSVGSQPVLTALYSEPSKNLVPPRLFWTCLITFPVLTAFLLCVHCVLSRLKSPHCVLNSFSLTSECSKNLVTKRECLIGGIRVIISQCVNEEKTYLFGSVARCVYSTVTYEYRVDRAAFIER